MKPILLILLALMMGGCEPENARSVSENNDIVIVEVDGCEYLRSYVYAGSVYTHKGNCKNHK